MNFGEARKELGGLFLDWNCFPCGADKKPQCKWKEEATGFDLWPPAADGAAYMGLPTGLFNGLFVIDLDIKPDKGVDGAAAFKSWLNERSIVLPENTPIVRTPSGGYHLYFRYPEGSDISIGQDMFGLRGVDWRGEGGYIIYYGLIQGSLLDLPDCPAAIVEGLVLAASKPKKASDVTQLRDASGRVVDGRDELARNLAYKLVMRKADALGQWPGSSEYPELLAELVDEYKKLASFDPSDRERNEVFLKEKLDYALTNCERKWERKKKSSLNERSKLSYQRLEDIKLESDSPYLVKGLLNRENLSVVYGAPACGKSFFVVDLAYHVAQGVEYRGAKVRGGWVLYCGLEGAMGIKNRLAGLRMDRGGCDRFFFSPSGFSMFEESGLESVLGLIDDIREAEGLSEGPAMVIIDTLARAMAPGSENAVEDMGQLVRHLDELKEETGAHVMLVHHTGKDKARGARGSNALLGAVDTEISIDNHDGLRVANATKQKDMDMGEPMYFRLEVMELGSDSDGDTVTTCLVEAVEPSENELARTKARERLSPVHQIALRLLEELWERKHPSDLPLYSADANFALGEQEWMAAMMKAGLFDDVEDGWKRYVAIRNKLVVTGWCVAEDKTVRPTKPAEQAHNPYTKFAEAVA